MLYELAGFLYEQQKNKLKSVRKTIHLTFTSAIQRISPNGKSRIPLNYTIHPSSRTRMLPAEEADQLRNITSTGCHPIYSERTKNKSTKSKKRK